MWESSVKTYSKRFILKCACGSEIIEFDKPFGNEKYINISMYASCFYSQQNNLFDKLKSKLKMIWYAITGKEFHLYEICLEYEDYDNFLNFLDEYRTLLLESKENSSHEQK